MLSFVVFATLLVSSLSLPLGEVDFTEDTLGNYNLKYKTEDASRTEQRFPDGKIIGSYSFIDTDGVSHSITYVGAEKEGFKAEGDSIPVAPQEIVAPVAETYDVIQARAQHLATVAEEKARFPQGVTEDKPVPIETVLARLVVPEFATLPKDAVPEVDAQHYQAKMDLIKAYKENLARLEEEYRRH